jgi:subtilisin-like proprotein convertase family protein
MKKARAKIAWLTITLFLAATWAGACPLSAAPSDSDETTRLLREADEAYQNGNFKLAIDKYQKAMQLIGEKKELAQTKQELFQTMTSLALTYFTIQENAKARKQLEDLVQVAPNRELDSEMYPPRFLEIFRDVQHDFLGRLTVTSVPPGAKVALDETPLGAAPLTAERVLKGAHSLKAELAGYAPIAREIVVQPGAENREELRLEALKPAVEKALPQAQAAKKKKKLSPLVIVGGVAVAAAAVLLLTGKNGKDEPEFLSQSFSNKSTVPIDAILPTYMPLGVEGVPARILKVEFRVVVSHPNHMEDLNINIVGTDNRTLFNIWNRGQSATAPTVITGTTEAFNNVTANGTWRLLVQNPGRSLGGEVREFTLRIFYKQ